jgi:hypothetical protein
MKRGPGGLVDIKLLTARLKSPLTLVPLLRVFPQPVKVHPPSEGIGDDCPF